MIGYAKHCKEKKALMYISVPIGENAFYEKKQNPRGEEGHPRSELAAYYYYARAGIWTRAPPCWKSCRHFAKDKKKTNL